MWVIKNYNIAEIGSDKYYYQTSKAKNNQKKL